MIICFSMDEVNKNTAKSIFFIKVNTGRVVESVHSGFHFDPPSGQSAGPPCVPQLDKLMIIDNK
jgi:hypothetical protein